MHSLLSPDHPHSCREFSVPRALFLCPLFFSCMNVASSSSSAELLSQLLAHLRILLVSPYFSSPVLLFSFSCFMSRSRVKPSATTGSADEKGISPLSFSRPSASLLSSHLPSYSNFFALLPLFLPPLSLSLCLSAGRLCAWSCEEEERRCGARRRVERRAPFLIFPGTIVSA